MIKHLLTSAMIAGLAAGVLAALLQLGFVTPLLLEGELYETGARLHFSATGSPQSGAGAPSLLDNPARHVGTLAMNLVTYMGFAFLLVSGFAVAERQGKVITARTGAIWGLCAFAALYLAPSMGLPPELPGTIAAELRPRQIWWGLTVVASLSAMVLLGYGRGWGPVALGVGLLIAPHVFGAPRLDTYFGVAAPELAAHFTARVLGVAAATWVGMGAIAGWVWTIRT